MVNHQSCFKHKKPDPGIEISGPTGHKPYPSIWTS